MLRSEEVRRPLQRPVQFPLTSEVQHRNYIDRSFGGVFARWRGLGLGIPSLAQLARSQDERVTTLLEPICGIYEGSSTREIDPNPLRSLIQYAGANAASDSTLGAIWRNDCKTGDALLGRPSENETLRERLAG